ncbi:MAG: glycosyltransferase family 2 protein [Promethearchaeota archaeon]
MTSIPNVKSQYTSKESKKSQKTKRIYDYKISVVIPVYNEEKSIQEVINRIPNDNEYEIIVVDDGSRDDSLKNARESNKKIILIQHQTNKGYGAAIMTGFKRATGDIIVTLDSDGQHHPEDIPSLIEPILAREADFVVGSRYLGRSNYKIPLHTRLGEFIIKTSIWLLFHQKIGNNQGGFRAFRKEMLKIYDEMYFLGMGFTTEMLFKAAYKRFKIIEIPTTIAYRKHGHSRVKVVRLLKSIFSLILIYMLLKMNIKKIVPKSILDRMKKMSEKFFKINY